jgi:hypothetical protein
MFFTPGRHPWSSTLAAGSVKRRAAANSAPGAAPEAQFERTTAHRKPSRAGESLPPRVRSTLPFGAVFSPGRHPWSSTLAAGSVKRRAAANSARGAAPEVQLERTAAHRKPSRAGENHSHRECARRYPTARFSALAVIPGAAH